ncbi:hypothetical protein TNCT_495451, partial [Trichonephila clavata]
WSGICGRVGPGVISQMQSAGLTPDWGMIAARAGTTRYSPGRLAGYFDISMASEW